MKGKKNWNRIMLMTAALLMLTAGQVFAAVTPSVAQKAGPEVVGTATYIDAEGNATVIDAAKIIITPDAKTGTLSPEQKAVYDEAKALLMDPESEFADELAAFMTENYPGIPAENIVVREIFEIDYSQELSFDNGQKLELTLSGSYKEGDPVIVTIFNKDTGKWDFIETSDVKVNADGTITVKFPHLCPAAILVYDQGAETASVVPAEEGGSNTLTLLLVGLGVLIVAAVVFLILKKKKTA
ncbi:LPXTG cell wall anchor domain-containing protein [Acetobacterium wieringae]|uniref:LPXTG cell wall anchor domain-containing protein n=1 Tax=Acetobacterium wieringae TaxID=52694 RepID=UPI0020346F69|nr:LPXTG cell wall anchor domain-containing protein [Acetobacterium wieringae]URN84124.1 LPXTG cell wall anchor domain-containing protein [Acetobacterium wieringae]